MITTAVRTVRTAAVIYSETPKDTLTIEVIAFTCVKVPLPKQAVITPKMENSTPRNL